VFHWGTGRCCLGAGVSDSEHDSVVATAVKEPMFC
jgi:hypothetical protein